MKKFITLATVSLFALGASASYAGGNTGCGLGSVLLKGKKGKVWELAATCLNGLCGNQSFAITSGTLGYQEGAVIGMNRVETFVAQNMDNLANDIAKGNGEYVDTLASLLEVKDADAFKANLKSNFAKIYTSDSITSKEVVANIKEVSNS